MTMEINTVHLHVINFFCLLLIKCSNYEPEYIFENNSLHILQKGSTLPERIAIFK